MAATQNAPAVPATSPTRVRKIDSADLRAALREAWQDFLAMRGDLLFIGLLYPLIGLIAAAISLGGALIPLFFPVAAGLSLLGPLTAIGFYEMARRREEGLESDWSHFLDVRKRPSFDHIQVVAGALIILFFIWVAVAFGLYVALWGPSLPESVSAFLIRLFTTDEGWQLIIAGNLIGAVFAIATLAISVVSLPMLVDCQVDCDAGSAVATSIEAVRANFGVMVKWGFIVAFLLTLGSIPLFIGLAVILPWLGYATWHLYTKLVDRSPR